MFKDSDDFIDSVQKAKKDFVKMFVTHEPIAKARSEEHTSELQSH